MDNRKPRRKVVLKKVNPIMVAWGLYVLNKTRLANLSILPMRVLEAVVNVH